MLLYVVSPTRRGTSEAFQILVSHALGDAGSPFLKLNNLPGALNKTMTVCEANIDFYSMQYSLLINVFVVGLGAVFFFLTAIWIVRDKIKAENPEAYKNAKNS